MSIRALIANIERAKSALIANRDNEALRIAFDLTALIKLRIQTEGKDADNKPFVPYDPDYAKERKGAGYQIAFVDFTRTGRLMANIRPRLESAERDRATVVIEGDSQLSKDILSGQARKRGNILRASKEERAMVEQANRERVLKYLTF
jgi:hypothetical protein